MAGQPPPLQGSEDDFLDQFFSMAAGGSYSAAAAGGDRVAGDQPFSLALSLDAAAEASGSGKRLGGDAEGGKAVSVPQPRTHLSLPLSPFSLSPLHQTNLCACYVLQKKNCASHLQDRDAVQLPGLFPPVFGAGVQTPHLRPNPPPQVLCSLQQRCTNYERFSDESAGLLLIVPRLVCFRCSTRSSRSRAERGSDRNRLRRGRRCGRGVGRRLIPTASQRG
jgi:hypothetical protein